MQHFLSFAPAFFTLMLTIAMLWVIWRDAAEYIISNRLNGFVLALFLLGIFLFPISLQPALITAGIVFAVGLLLFTLGLMGGGDIKLLMVLSLWAGWPATGQLLLLTSVIGGLLVLIIAPLRRIVPPLWAKRLPARTLPRILTRKEPIPYGLAIAGAFLIMLWTGDIPALAR
jgi:prepilin peptidase CpaA